MRVGVIAAMPGELKPLVRGWTRMPVARGSGVAMWQTARGRDEIVAVCAGMGAAAARRAFTAAEHDGALDEVLSVGWAGALVESCAARGVYSVSEIVDAQTGERFAVPAARGGMRLVTTARVADAAEKARLRGTYQASLVDMEAATVARLAQMRGIPMYCLKAVSDDAKAELPDLNPFIGEDGKLRMPAFLAHVALRPRFWGALGQLGANSSAAAKGLALAVEDRLKKAV